MEGFDARERCGGSAGRGGAGERLRVIFDLRRLMIGFL